jgi:hypothetical protein
VFAGYRRAIAAITLLAWTPSAALAHKGPPFPLIVDKIVGPYVTSVWADPDIGTGTFYVVLEPRDGVEWVDPTAIQVAVRPVSGRLPEVAYDAEPERVRTGARYVALVQFDRGEFWDVRVTIESPGGGGELTSQVEATPDGSVGSFGLVIYAFPFVLVAALWLRAVMARRKMEREAAESIEPSS